MNRKNGAAGFDIAEYSEHELGIEDVNREIKQIFVEMGKRNAAFSIWPVMTGNQLRLQYHTYTMHLPTHMKQVQGQADDIFKESLRELKAELKRRKIPAKFTELKDRANYTIEKVSLNERYYYKAWRVFEVSI
jgi:hypothetical protein